MNIENYQTLVFDCDGVILNSNKVKTDAFFKAALPYGESAALQLVNYHISRGGISRYKKFEWFLETIVAGKTGPNLSELLKSYASEVKHGLLTCEVAEGLETLKEKTPSANWLIVSGGDEQELREVFRMRGLTNLFNGGIFGSPDNKDTILTREIRNNNIKFPAIFFGDSQYDYESSNRAAMDFVFLTQWSEFKEWKNFFNEKKLVTANNFSDFISKINRQVNL
jgi:phosphoglycolate phosphatase-like HAD superfamily hydrolase